MHRAFAVGAHLDLLALVAPVYKDAEGRVVAAFAVRDAVVLSGSQSILWECCGSIVLRTDANNLFAAGLECLDSHVYGALDLPAKANRVGTNIALLHVAEEHPVIACALGAVRASASFGDEGRILGIEGRFLQVKQDGLLDETAQLRNTGDLTARLIPVIGEAKL